MSKRRQVRSYEYVNHSYEKVRAALTEDSKQVFRSATTAAASRAHDLAAKLEVRIAGVDVGREIDITVGVAHEVQAIALRPTRTVIPIEWQAAESPGLFPLMKGQLEIYPLTATETQLDFSGEYDPPLGVVGDAVDAVVGHRLAEASVQRFVADVGAYLRKALGKA
ncbi:MAG TPA: hypothetical protein VNB06_02585 [Thermoanaerobaculia bacterium]|nr:hypothetical protein [Thermoanaerobaculia bacterium]